MDPAGLPSGELVGDDIRDGSRGWSSRDCATSPDPRRTGAVRMPLARQVSTLSAAAAAKSLSTVARLKRDRRPPAHAVSRMAHSSRRAPVHATSPCIASFLTSSDAPRGVTCVFCREKHPTKSIDRWAFTKRFFFFCSFHTSSITCLLFWCHILHFRSHAYFIRAYL